MFVYCSIFKVLFVIQDNLSQSDNVIHYITSQIVCQHFFENFLKNFFEIFKTAKTALLCGFLTTQSNCDCRL